MAIDLMSVGAGFKPARSHKLRKSNRKQRHINMQTLGKPQTSLFAWETPQQRKHKQ